MQIPLQLFGPVSYGKGSCGKGMGIRMEKKKWVKHIPLFILELVVLAAAACVLYVTLRATDKEGGAIKDNLHVENIAVNEEVKEKVEEIEQVGTGNSYTGIINVAFFGVDARDGSLGKGNRSDTIMVCSINMDTHEVRLISIYRDTYLNLGNDIYKKCNSAYARGGPEQAIGMINMNTDLYVTDYITVGFEGLMKAVDALGGIEMDITETEMIHLNNSHPRHPPLLWRKACISPPFFCLHSLLLLKAQAQA